MFPPTTTLLAALAPSCLLLLPTTVLAFSSQSQSQDRDHNSTIHNPILPGFHPDPSCIFVPSQSLPPPPRFPSQADPDSDDDNGTGIFLCASSSFNAFPGIPLHASYDLTSWKLIGHVLNRPSQLPRLAETNRSTSGIWAPTLRYRDDTFWLLTTLVDDDRPKDDSSRWDNVIFRAKDPWDPRSWSDAVHFEFEGYDTELFWDVNGKVYINGAHAWQVGPAIQQAEANLETGEVGEWKTIWEGTGGMAPEGPHIYYRDGWYYLLAAEGGTGVDHMVTMARSRSVHGPFEANPVNPVLTNANTTSLFQTVGHADLFQDASGNWWGVALSTRSGPSYINYPMGRETVLTPVSWPLGSEFPVWSPLSGTISAWPLPQPKNKTIPDGPMSGPCITEGDHITNFSMTSKQLAHFTHWRFPNLLHYDVSPPERNGTLKLNPSTLNLTGLENGNYAGAQGQAFVGRRQQDTLFRYAVDLDFIPEKEEDEAGVSVFLTQNHHLDLGVVLLPSASATASLFPGPNVSSVATEGGGDLVLVPHVRFRGISYVPVPELVVVPLPEQWTNGSLTLEIKAINFTHYAFSVGPAGRRSEMQTVVTASNAPVSWGFTGTILGVYCTSNGRRENGRGAPVYVSKWVYEGEGQYRD